MKTLCLLSIVLGLCAAARAQDSTPNSYTETNLVSDVAGKAANIDPNLVNPWGLSHSATTPWWVSDEAGGHATVYNGSGVIGSLVVNVPPATGAGKGVPTGVVSSGSAFIFATLDGTISEWTSGSQAVIKVNNSSEGAVYTGIAAADYGQTLFYVANSAGGIETYTTAFSRITLLPGAFTDPNIPVGYAPYGIQSAGGNLWVTYASGPGAGNGYVDEYSPGGVLLLSLAHGNWMNEPWGVAVAPADFGLFSSAVLVANTGNGLIAAFNPTTGAYAGVLKNSAGATIKIPGLWGIGFGGGGNSGPTTTLYFTAGIDNYTKGLFGSITANPN